MAKIVKVLIICLLLFSCNKHSYVKEEYDIYFFYGDWIKIDFNSKLLGIDYLRLHYKDTLILTHSDETAIINSFERNKINEVQGNAIYASNGYLVMPPSGLKIDLFYKRKLQSKMFIEYSFPVKTLLPISQKNRVVNFRNDILKILNRNKQLEKAKMLLVKYQSDNGFLNL